HGRIDPGLAKPSVRFGTARFVSEGRPFRRPPPWIEVDQVLDRRRGGEAREQLVRRPAERRRGSGQAFGGWRFVRRTACSPNAQKQHRDPSTKTRACRPPQT